MRRRRMKWRRHASATTLAAQGSMAALTSLSTQACFAFCTRSPAALASGPMLLPPATVACSV